MVPEKGLKSGLLHASMHGIFICIHLYVVGSIDTDTSFYMLCTFRYPLELHLVHRNIHDDTVQEALTHENGMTVLGFKFKIVDDENVNIVLN